MSDAALFVVGSIVTLIAVTGLVALWYAAVVDGRTEERRAPLGDEPGPSDSDPSLH
ncbi:hypothetical protein BH23ACT10_BH23ACT10_02550 [soil metagenome]